MDEVIDKILVLCYHLTDYGKSVVREMLRDLLTEFRYSELERVNGHAENVERDLSVALSQLADQRPIIALIDAARQPGESRDAALRRVMGGKGC